MAGRIHAWAYPAATVLLLAGCESEPTSLPVTPPSGVDRVEVSAPSTEVQVGASMPLSATAWSRSGAPLEGRSFTWTSSDTTRARVTPEGILLALAAGTVRVTASTGGRSGALDFQLAPPPPPPPPATPVLIALAPAQVRERSGAFHLVLEGEGFDPTSRVLWNELPLVTTFDPQAPAGPGTGLRAQVPEAWIGQPLEVEIRVETPGTQAHPEPRRSERLPFTVLPRPLHSLTIEARGSHVFTGGALHMEVELRNDLGERAPWPTMRWTVDDPSVAGFDFMGNLRGWEEGATWFRVAVENEETLLETGVHFTVGPAPVQSLVLEARPWGLPELFRFDLDGAGFVGNGLWRILPEGTRAMEPAVHPSGTLIAFAGIADDGSVNIWTVRPDGTELRRLTNVSFRADQPAFSPDGRTIVYRSWTGPSPELRGMNLDGSNARVLVPAASGSEARVMHPTFFPDGTRILFSRSHGAEAELWSAPATGFQVGRPEAQHRVLAMAGRDLLHPAWTPAGDAFLFEVRDRLTGERRVQVANPAGGLLHPLNPPDFDAGRPLALGGGWVAVVGRSGPGGSSTPTLRIQELNGTRMAIPVAPWMGRVERAAILSR